VNQVQIYYTNLEETQVIYESEQYEKALDKLQTVLCFFKIPHELKYSPDEKKEYTFTFENMEISLSKQLNTI
jgi:hypothetical protein